MTWWALVPAAYLSGAIPFAYLITRRAIGIDVRTVGSGNPGATNVLHVAGGRPALVVLLLDIAKGLVPILSSRLLGAPAEVLAAAALAAVVGHVYSVFLGGRGGKGVATAVGSFLGVAPTATAAALLVFGLTLAWKRYVSLASVVGLGSLPLWIYLSGRWGVPEPSTGPVLAAAAAASLLIVVRHRSNLRRLAAGTEGRVGERLEVGSE